MGSHYYRALKPLSVVMGNGSKQDFGVGQLVAIPRQDEANRMLCEGLVQSFEFTRPQTPKPPESVRPAPGPGGILGQIKLLIKFPTRGRADKFFDVIGRYHGLLSGRHDVRFVVSCDVGDESMNCDESKKRLRALPDTVAFFGDNKSKVEAVNSDLDEDMDFDVLLLASDDMIPEVAGFDDVIARAMGGHYPDLDGVLWFNDGYVGKKLNTLVIIGHRYYERFRYIYHPSYKSVWCDNEFMDVANLLHRQTYIEQVIIRHAHPTWDAQVAKDAVYDRNEADYSEDKANYERRKTINFEMG